MRFCMSKFQSIFPQTLNRYGKQRFAADLPKVCTYFEGNNLAAIAIGIVMRMIQLVASVQ